MSIRLIEELDFLKDGADKSNYNDNWLRTLVSESINSGYEESFTSQATWVVNHGLNTEIFTYLCVDNGTPPTQIYPTSMTIDSANQITVNFSSPQSGAIKVMFGFSGWVYPAQSEVGLPSDENWDDGVTAHGVITATTKIADAIDAVNQAAHAVPPTAGGNNLQGAYDKAGPPAGNIITVDAGKEITFRAPASPSARDILLISQEFTSGIPLTVYNSAVAADPSIKLTGGTRVIASESGNLELQTLSSGHILATSAQDVRATLGDAAGANSFVVKDSTSADVFIVSSLGDVSANKISPDSVLDSKMYGFVPQTDEVYSPSERPQIYVKTATDHLMYVDSTGSQYDIIEGLFTTPMAEDVFIVDSTLITNGYFDLSSTPVLSSEFIYMNGVCLTKNDGAFLYDYAVGGGGDPAYRVRFESGVSLILGAKIHAKYQTDPGLDTIGTEIFIVNAGIISSRTLTLSNTPINTTEYVILNGVTLTKGASYDYTVAGTNINLTAGVDIELGDQFSVRYKY